MVEVHRPRFFPFVAWIVEHSPTEGSVLQSLRRGRDFEVVNPRLGLTYGSTPTGWTNPNVNERGNMTTTRRWLNISGSTGQTYPNGSFIETHAQNHPLGHPP